MHVGFLEKLDRQLLCFQCLLGSELPYLFVLQRIRKDEWQEVKGREDVSLGEDTTVINLTFIFLLITLTTTLIVQIQLFCYLQVIPLQKFTFTKKFGIVLMLIYVISMVLNILVAGGILRIPFLEPR